MLIYGFLNLALINRTALKEGIGPMKHSEAFVRLVDEVMPEIKEVTIEEVKEKLGKMASNSSFHLVDVREDNEWDKGRIKGSIHIGRGVLERDIETLIENKSDEIVLYCGGGFRSALAAFNMQKMGYGNVYSMQGGIRAWREKEYPEEC